MRTASFHDQDGELFYVNPAAVKKAVTDKSYQSCNCRIEYIDGTSDLVGEGLPQVKAGLSSAMRDIEGGD